MEDEVMSERALLALEKIATAYESMAASKKTQAEVSAKKAAVLDELKVVLFKKLEAIMPPAPLGTVSLSLAPEAK